MDQLEYCPSCKKPFRIPETHLGRKVRCNDCGTVFVTGEGDKAASAVVPQLKDDDSDAIFGRSVASSSASAPPSLPGGRVGEAMDDDISGAGGADESTIMGQDFGDWMDLEKGAETGGKSKKGGGFLAAIKGIGGQGTGGGANTFQTGILERLSAAGILLVVTGVVALATGDAAKQVFRGIWGGSSEPTSAKLLSQVEDGQRLVLGNPVVGKHAAAELPLPALPGDRKKPVFVATIVDEDQGGVLAVVVTSKLDDVRISDGVINLDEFSGYINGQASDRPELMALTVPDPTAASADEGVQDEAEAAEALTVPFLDASEGGAWVIEDGAPLAGTPGLGFLDTVFGLLTPIGMVALLAGIGISVMAWISGGYGGDSDLAAPGVLLGYAVLGFVLTNFVGAVGIKYWAWLGVIAGLLVFGFGWLGLASATAQRSTWQGLLCLVGPFAPVQMATRWNDAKEPTTWIVAGLGSVVIAVGGISAVAGSVEGSVPVSGNRLVASMLSFSESDDDLNDAKKLVARVIETTPKEVEDAPIEEDGPGIFANEPAIADGGVVDNTTTIEEFPTGGQTSEEIAPEPVVITEAADIPLGTLPSLPPRNTDELSGAGFPEIGAMPEVMPRRTVSEAFADPQIRSFMDPTEKLAGGYGFFVSRDFDLSLEEDHMGRYWRNLGTQVARVEFTVYDLPKSLVDGTLKGQDKPVLTPDGQGVVVNGYYGTHSGIKLLKERGVNVKTMGSINGIQFVRVEMRPERRMQTVYYVGLDQGKLLTFRLDAPGEHDDYLTIMAVLQGSVASIAPIQ